MLNFFTVPERKRSLIGPSMFVATATITGVQKTQKISYKKSPHRRIKPFVVEPRLIIAIPCMAMHSSTIQNIASNDRNLKICADQEMSPVPKVDPE